MFDVWVRVSQEFDIQPVAIAWTSVRQLRNKQILLVIVVWRSDKFEEETWEIEEFMRKNYLHFFEPVDMNFEDKIPN